MTSQRHVPESPSAAAQDDHELGFDLPAPAVVSRPLLVGLAGGAAVLLGAAFLFGYLPRHRERAVIEDAARGVERTTARVDVVTPRAASSERAVSLPGSVQPLEETVLYARASGFVRRWMVDIGDKVTEGQLLAQIETPDLDQEIEQARAQLAQAQPTLLRSQANRELSAANLKRYQQLAPIGVASQVELDTQRAQSQADEASVSVAQATIAAQEANIRRLTQLKAFARVVAPFAGTVTQRWVEVGALVTAGNGQPLYKVAAMDPARVFVQVPQDVAPGVRAGVAAKVNVREYGGRVFEGTVSRAAKELDAATRTMTTEIRVPNTDGALIAGMYADVSLTLPSPHQVFELPATSLMTDARGTRVAVIGSDGAVRLVPVVVERDTGSTIEIASGLQGGEQVAKFGSADLGDGKVVEPVREVASAK